MSGERHRVVSIGDRRSAQRVLDIAANAAAEVLAKHGLAAHDASLSISNDIALNIAQAFLDQGMAVTWQVAP